VTHGLLLSVFFFFSFFVSIQSKVVVAKVPGANGPDLEAAILDNMSSSE
jgi:hypothetical protein